MIKISHEVPISLLKESLKWNDYQYALVHLFEEHPDYYAFYKECIEKGIHVILDNSVFELGEAFDTQRFVAWIRKLQPQEFIIPDALANATETCKLAESFLKEYGSELLSSSIGVAQGETYGDFVQCYKMLDRQLNIPKIAIPFTAPFFNDHFSHPNKYLANSLGRVSTLTKMMNDGIINKQKKHHLLGCYAPIEFSMYGEEFSWIDTLDTSSPVVHGIKGISYTQTGIMKKDPSKLIEFITSEVNTGQLKLIEKNISLFRGLLQ